MGTDNPIILGKKFVDRSNIFFLLLTLSAASFSYTLIGGFELQTSTEPEFCGPFEIVEEDRYINRIVPTQNERWSSYVNDDVPDYNYFINRHEVRNEPFPLEKEEDEYRIAVFGASRSRGYGVNNSDTYHQILEENLDEQLSGDIRVINAAHGRYGMEDRYTYLLNDGLELDPDLVLIPFSKSAELSHVDYDRIGEEVREEFNLSKEAEFRNHPEAFEELGARHLEYEKKIQESGWEDSNIRKYGNLISLLGDKEDFEVIFYWLEPDFEYVQEKSYSSVEIENNTYESPITAMKNVCGLDIIASPDEFQENQEDYRYDPEIYVYNKKGHEKIANDLTQKLKPEINN